MTVKRNDAGEYEFTRAAYDELADGRSELGVSWEVCIRPSEQRGVWLLEVSGVNMRVSEPATRMVRYTAHWPNSTAQTFGAFLYSCCHRAVRMAESYRANELQSRAAGAL